MGNTNAVVKTFIPRLTVAAGSRQGRKNRVSFYLMLKDPSSETECKKIIIRI